MEIKLFIPGLAFGEGEEHSVNQGLPKRAWDSTRESPIYYFKTVCAVTMVIVFHRVSTDRHLVAMQAIQSGPCQPDIHPRNCQSGSCSCIPKRGGHISPLSLIGGIKTPLNHFPTRDLCPDGGRKWFARVRACVWITIHLCQMRSESGVKLTPQHFKSTIILRAVSGSARFC